MGGFGSSLVALYNGASEAATSRFNEMARASTQAIEEFKAKGASAAGYAKERISDGAACIKHRVHQKVSSAKRAADKVLKPHPAGARIQPCPKGKKAERVKERAAKIRESKERADNLPPGKRREALTHASARLERNNTAVERARLANDTYNVGQGDPPEGWQRVTGAELKKLGMTADSFPQLRSKFNPEEYKDGYYPELYKSKKDVFGEERYVLSFRGTQGAADGKADLVQAFGGETDQYTRAIKTAQKLKKVLGDDLDITGHSMGGGMAAAAGIVTGSPVYAIDPAGVHPATLERFGKEYTRKMADEHVENFVAEGEFLDTVQQPTVQRTMLAGIATATPKGAAIVSVAGRRSLAENGTVTYAAAGPVYKVPILENAKDVADGKSDQGMSAGLGGKINNFANPKRKVELHDPVFVIAGIEQQKADDLNVIDRNLTT